MRPEKAHSVAFVRKQHIEIRFFVIQINVTKFIRIFNEFIHRYVLQKQICIIIYYFFNYKSGEIVKTLLKHKFNIRLFYTIFEIVSTLSIKLEVPLIFIASIVTFNWIVFMFSAFHLLKGFKLLFVLLYIFRNFEHFPNKDYSIKIYSLL